MPSVSNMSVPVAARPVLRWLATLSGDAADQLLRQFQAESQFRSADDLCRVLSRVDEVSADEARRLVNVLLNLIAISRSHGWAMSDVVREVAFSRVLEISDEERSLLLDRLQLATDAPSIVGLAKAADIAVEHDHLFHTSRLLTDIRPVFNDDLASGPLGAVLSHTLRIDYYDRTVLKTFAVTLTNDELDELETSVSRAKLKRGAVQAWIESTGLTDFDTVIGD